MSCVVLMLSLWAIGSFSHPAAAQEADDLTEVFWEFKHAGVINTVISSRYDGERFYISLGDLFGALQVNLVQEPSINMARGFYLQQNRQYEIDFNAGRAFLGNKEVRFDSTDYVRGTLGFFLSPELYRELFNLSVSLNERTLAMTLSTPDEMPAVAEYRRRQSRVIREETSFLQRNAPLLFDRNRSFMSGGVVGYRLSTEVAGGNPRANINLRGGGELLGGDLQLGVSGNYGTAVAGTPHFNFNLNSWRWRYVVQSLPAFRQAQIGELSSDGLRSFNYVGTRLSNDPVGAQRFFGSYPMRIESEPGWEIEIYLNNQLIDVQTADAAGITTFSVPITYGSTSVTVREYGPSGEYRESERRIEVPFSFVPPGEIRYNLFAGRGSQNARNLIQATTSVGITSWLTAKWGFDYVTPDTSIAGESLANLSWGSVSARIGPSYVITARAAPGALYNASVSAFYPSLASITLQYTHFGDNLIYNRSRRLHESQASVSFPFRVGGLPINWRTSLTERRVEANRYTFSAQQNLSFQPGVFRLNIGVRGQGNYANGAFTTTSLRLEPRMGYSFSRTGEVPRPLRGLLLSLRSSVNLRTKTLTSISANFSRTVMGLIRVQTDLSHQFQGNNSSISFRIAFDLNSLRTTTRANLQSSGRSVISQDLSGALSYDMGTKRVNLSDRDWVGRSAATIRMFVDYDGDGQQNGKEPLIENGGVNFRRTISTRRNDKGLIVAYNLQAYEQYNLTVDQSRIRNPFWVPKFEEFSFITDPNTHKVIDIPFYVGGEVTGSVLRRTPDGLIPVPGLKMHLYEIGGERSFTEPVFSDGTFYKLGMPPGTYRARVDSTQMSILRAVSDPPDHEFTVEATETGDVVDGIDFVLVDSAVTTAEAPDDQQPEAPDEQVEAEIQVVEPEDRVEPADPAVPPQEATVYIVKPGLEGLKELARMVYDDESLWPKIWLANSELIEEPEDLKSGMRLVIPPKAPLTPVERAAGAGYDRGAAPRQDDDRREERRRQDDRRPQPGQDADRAGDDGQAVHTVRRSDRSLMALARRYYDNGFLWPKIWVANHGVLPNPDRLEPGMDLVIPPKAPLTDEERRALEAYEAGRLTWEDADTTGAQPQRQEPEPDQPQPVDDQEPADDQQQEEQPADDQQQAAEDRREADAQAEAPQAGHTEDPQTETPQGDVMAVHTVTRGDVSVMNLARKYYDDWTLWPKIWVANRDILPTPETMEIGMELKIPEKAPLTAAEQAALDEYTRNR